MTNLYIIRGAPGSGKSTLARAMRSSGMVDFHVEADMFMVENGDYKFRPGWLAKCHKMCLEATKRRLGLGDNVAVANTFTRIWEMRPYLDFCKENDIGVTVIMCEGHFQNIHGVPAEKVKEMRDRIEPYGKPQNDPLRPAAAALAEAYRKGQEDMREQAAEYLIDNGLFSYSQRIRDLPITGKDEK